jgi:hypothetical protein
VLPRAFLDPLVDRPEDFFVVGGRLGEVHAGIVPRFVPNANEHPGRERPAGRSRIGYKTPRGAPVRGAQSDKGG